MAKKRKDVIKTEHFGIQRKIVANMTTESWQNIPHVTYTYEPDVTEFMEQYKLLNNGALAAVEPLDPGALAEGAAVVTREEAVDPAAAKSAKSSGGSKNPLLPNMPKRPRGGPPPPG